MKCPRSATRQRQRADEWLPGVGGLVSDSQQVQVSFESDENVLKWIMVARVQSLSFRASQVAQWLGVRLRMQGMQEMCVQSLDREDTLE